MEYILEKCPFYLVFSILMSCASLVLYKDHGVTLRCFFQLCTCTQRVFQSACLCFKRQYINSICFSLSYFCISFSAEVYN